jgi:hypothetical protein
MLNSLRISSGVLPLIMFATVLQPTSLWVSAGETTIRRERARHLQEGLNVEVVGSEDDFEEHLLVDLKHCQHTLFHFVSIFVGVSLLRCTARAREQHAHN